MAKVVMNFLLLPLLLLEFICSSDHHGHVAASKSAVGYLPGFQGPLPFYFETGYIGLGEAELFYYFVKSDGNPEADPLILWLSGGPGCSAFSGLVLEIGPIRFQGPVAGYSGSLPNLILNPFSWTKFSSIIFLDLPVGTGFSYTTNPSPADHPGDQVQVSQAAEFIRKWLGEHSEFLQNPLYVAGDSYSGTTIPPIVQRLSIGNEKGIRPMLNLKGYIIGNPVTDSEFDGNARIPFAHGMALISDELYKSLHKSCKGEYQTVEPTNLECKNNLKAFSECLSGINVYGILDPDCNVDPEKAAVRRRTMLLQDEFQLLLTFDPPKLGCKYYDFSPLCKRWANDELVRKALHIREGTIGEWERCNNLSDYQHDIPSSFVYHVNLSTKGYRSLIYSGDHDMVIPFVGTQAWIRALNYSIVEDWRSWHVEGQVAGYTRTYSNRMTFATVKGGWHTSPSNKPAECHAMLQRWINYESL
ncbi:unnamed protein product [Linum trigynum]|uniref:Uncharacterized protein n=1 Tax=Linum trigynum TaxID=586398 RepID=A0AAV2DFA8_9ROSI